VAIRLAQARLPRNMALTKILAVAITGKRTHINRCHHTAHHTLIRIGTISLALAESL